jgi:hypothetical protein
MDSIFSQMDWPTLLLIGRDSISGVSICSGIYDSKLGLTLKRGGYSYNHAQEVSGLGFCPFLSPRSRVLPAK